MTGRPDGPWVPVAFQLRSKHAQLLADVAEAAGVTRSEWVRGVVLPVLLEQAAKGKGGKR